MGPQATQYNKEISQAHHAHLPPIYNPRCAAHASSLPVPETRTKSTSVFPRVDRQGYLFLQAATTANFRNRDLTAFQERA